MRHLRPVRSSLVAQLLMLFLVCALHCVNAQTTTVGQKARGAVNPANPCCEITSIDASGRVTAQDKATGKSFQFQVNDSGLLNSLHLGQAVSADYAANQVAVAPGIPCCQITGTGMASTGGVTNIAGTPGTGTSGSPGVIQSKEMEDTPGVVAELTEATREEDVLTIKVIFRNTSDKPVRLDLTRGYLCNKYYVTAGTKRYPVLKDATEVYQMSVNPYCKDTAEVIAPGKIFTFYAKFPAPPMTVKKVDFFTPLMPPFEHVPITDDGSTSTGTSGGTLPPGFSTPNSCASGFYGPNCAPCPGYPNVCSNHGQCSDGMTGNGACACRSGYSGPACQNGP